MLQTQDFPSYLMSAEKNHVKKQAFEKLWYTIFTVSWAQIGGFILVSVKASSW